MTLLLQDVYAANILDTVRHERDGLCDEGARAEALVGVMKTIGQYWVRVRRVA